MINLQVKLKICLFHKDIKSLLVLWLTPHDSDEVRVPQTDRHELLLRDVALVIDINLAEQNLCLPYTFLFRQILNLKIKFSSGCFKKKFNIQISRFEVTDVKLQFLVGWYSLIPYSIQILIPGCFQHCQWGITVL